MLNNKVFYHGLIRKTIVSFGSLFSNIYIDRREGDSVTGNVIQRLQVPLAYAPKEKWLVRLDSDPNLEGNTYTSLPRMSFEILGYQYDAARKIARMNQITQQTGSNQNTKQVIFSPVPYNLDISLYILTKTQEDALQIIEQILPTFTPEYTLSITAIPDMSIQQDIPVILNSVQIEDTYDGAFQDRRFVTHTLNFTLKINLFGGLTDQNIIQQVNANVGQNENFSNPNRTYVAEGDVTTATVTNENWSNNL